MSMNELMHSTNKAIADMDTQTLRSELAKALTITAQVLNYLASVWAELERRGEDLSDLRTGIANYLPMIARGELDAEVVVKFAGQKTVMKYIATLPIEDQRRIASGESLPIAYAKENGEVLERTMPVQAMTAKQVAIVFDYGRIRSIEEQKSILSKIAPTPEKRRRRKVRLDRKTGKLLIGNDTLDVVKDVLPALSEYYGFDLTKVLPSR